MQLPSSLQSRAVSGEEQATVAMAASSLLSVRTMALSSPALIRMLGEPGEKHTRLTVACRQYRGCLPQAQV